ncbi:MAG TPA: LPS assembly protein LptD [Rhodanobacteraceae bacterium]|nr:LPS assembly protein LptD [Rhodanobacteraceae bacterium]
MRRKFSQASAASSLAAAVALALAPGTSRAAPAASWDYSQCRRPTLYADLVLGLPHESGDTVATDIAAQAMHSPDSQLFTLKGSVRIQHGEQLLRADQAQYQRDSGHYEAEGAVRYQDGSLLLRADRMQGTTTPRQATAVDVRYQLRDSRGNGTASSVKTLPEDQAKLREVRYSTCDIDHPGWLLSADRIELDQRSGMGSAHDVTVRVGGVPLLWLPYARFPIDDRRHTGVLYPTLGYSNDRGFDVTVPVYLNLAPNYDATLYPRLLSRRGLMLGTEFRYLTGISRGEFRHDYLPDDRVADRSRSLLRARSVTRLAPDWSLDVNINHVSDARYFEDFGDGLYGAATHLLTSSIYVRGSGPWWNAAVGADRHQITDPTLSEAHEPYRRMPRALFSADLPLAGGLSAGIDSEAVSFRRDTGIEGRRLDLYPFVQWALQGAAWHLRPRLAYRYTSYRLDRDSDASPSRALPIASVDAGLTFERQASLFGTSYTQTLEPRLYYLRVPYRDQSDLPDFDTRTQTFDFWQLFSPNRFSGADRQMNANNLTLALTSRLLDANGVQRLAASIGEIRYFEPQRVQLPGHAVTDYAGSAYVGQFSVALSDAWNLQAAQQWNPNTDRTDLSTIGLQRRFAGDGLFNISYRYRRDFLEQFGTSAVYPLGERWRLVGGWTVALQEHKTLDAFAGFQYDTCCVAIRVLGRHYVRNTAGDTGNTIMLQIVLKGLGAFGQRTENFLQHAILGYSP